MITDKSVRKKKKKLAQKCYKAAYRYSFFYSVYSSEQYTSCWRRPLYYFLFLSLNLFSLTCRWIETLCLDITINTTATMWNTRTPQRYKCHNAGNIKKKETSERERGREQAVWLFNTRWMCFHRNDLLFQSHLTCWGLIEFMLATYLWARSVASAWTKHKTNCFYSECSINIQRLWHHHSSIRCLWNGGAIWLERFWQPSLLCFIWEGNKSVIYKIEVHVEWC